MPESTLSDSAKGQAKSIRRWNWGLVSRLSVTVLILLIGVRVISRVWEAPGHLLTPNRMGDFGLNVELARQTVEHRAYAPDFAYPVPAVALWWWADRLGFTLSAYLWLVIFSAGMIACLWFCRQLSAEGADLAGGVVIATAFGATEYYQLWELSTVNVNSLYLALVLLGVWSWTRRWLAAAGLLLAASIALKLYSVALIPCLLWRREWRILFWLIGGLIVFFIGVPTLCFGWHDMLTLTRSWVQAVATTSQPDYTYPAYKVSVVWIAKVLLTAGASPGNHNLVSWDNRAAAHAAHLVVLGWICLVAVYCFLALRADGWRPARYQRSALLLDVSVALLFLLPASPTLQPHHLVVLLLPATCFARVVFSPQSSTSSKILASAILLGGILLTEAAHYPLRGIGVFLTLVLYLAGLMVFRRQEAARQNLEQAL